MHGFFLPACLTSCREFTTMFSRYSTCRRLLCDLISVQPAKLGLRSNSRLPYFAIVLFNTLTQSFSAGVPLPAWQVSSLCPTGLLFHLSGWDSAITHHFLQLQFLKFLYLFVQQECFLVWTKTFFFFKKIMLFVDLVPFSIILLSPCFTRFWHS